MSAKWQAIKGPMPKQKMLKLYGSIFDDPIYSGDPRQDDIAAEMRGVLRATSMREAKDVIDWWRCWESESELEKSIRLVRSTWIKSMEAA